MTCHDEVFLVFLGLVWRDVTMRYFLSSGSCMVRCGWYWMMVIIIIVVRLGYKHWVDDIGKMTMDGTQIMG